MLPSHFPVLKTNEIRGVPRGDVLVRITLRLKRFNYLNIRETRVESNYIIHYRDRIVKQNIIYLNIWEALPGTLMTKHEDNVPERAPHIFNIKGKPGKVKC